MSSLTITAVDVWTELDDDTREDLIDYLEVAIGRLVTEVLEVTFGEGTLRLLELEPDGAGGYVVDDDEFVTRTTVLGYIPAAMAPPPSVLDYLRNRAHR